MHIRSQISKLKRDTATLSYDRADAVKTLKAMGYKELGRGAFAVAMMHPEAPDVVVKVSQWRSGRGHVKAAGYVDGFGKYVWWLDASRTRSKFALKVYHHRQISRCNGDTFITITERCYPGKGAKAQRSVTVAQHVMSGIRFKGEPDVNSWALKYLRRLTLDTGAKLDLHGANVMLRRDGSPVITDPLILRGY